MRVSHVVCIAKASNVCTCFYLPHVPLTSPHTIYSPHHTALCQYPTLTPPYPTHTDLEVQFSAEGGHWQCDSALCQSVNGDIFHVDLGNQSVQEPRLLRIVLINVNPYTVSVTCLFVVVAYWCVLSCIVVVSTRALDKVHPIRE